MEDKNQNPYQPLYYAIIFAIGLLIGWKLSGTSNLQFMVSGNYEKGSQKINQLLNYIEQEYVDTISRKRLAEDALVAILQNLDPHSAYIPASEVQAMNEPMQGNFEGIGIEFNLLKDTIMVVSVIAGGPSESLGIKAGDRIVSIEKKSVAGIKIKNEDVLKKLRGKGGTKVEIGIFRRGYSKILNYTIIRGKIPIYSIESSYMLSPTTGYIRISRFASTTYDEFIEASDKLLSSGMHRLVLDLRGNPGGYLSTAISICDEFLTDGQRIVYTLGKSHPKEEFIAKRKGGLENIELSVIIDEGSASASEIVSGAIQDNDRGVIIGRRSFGKGLVQQQSDFSDGSALRLTIARYYTPTGRCIQKPYEKGDLEAYYNEENNRFKHGELVNADSIHFADSLKFKTPKGKIVYGGGGIMPDIFVPIDTSMRSEFIINLWVKGTVNQFAINYCDKERGKLKQFSDYKQFYNAFKGDEKLYGSFLKFAESEKIKAPSSKERELSKKFIMQQLTALIARNLWRGEGYYWVMNQNDPAVQKAMGDLGE